MFTKNIEELNLDKKRNISLVFDDVIADVINNTKLHLIVTEVEK